jgi:hypothetical protein
MSTKRDWDRTRAELARFRLEDPAGFVQMCFQVHASTMDQVFDHRDQAARISLDAATMTILAEEEEP